MSRIVCSCVVTLFLVVGSSAFAQIIYEPVQYQYSSGGSTYYYGGSNPHVHIDANRLSQDPGFGRTNGYAFHSASLDTHREVVTEPTRLYSDTIPFWNARFFGYTIDDARNAANANAARYFRKADLSRMVQPERDGTWSVPPQVGEVPRGTIEIRPWKPVMTTTPVIDPKPFLVIPKRLLDKPLWPSNTPTADAR